MRRAAVIAGVLAATGCASLIGASFDDAGLGPDGGEPDATPDVHDSAIDAPEFEDSDAPSFDPSSLPNLALWLDATYAVDVADGGAAVTRWHDRSTNARDAVPAGAGTNAPTRVANALNGLPVIHFVASQLDLLVTPWVGPGGAAVSMFIVTRGYPQSALRFQSSVGTFPFLIFPVDGNGLESNPSFFLSAGMTSPTYIQLRVPLDGGPSLASATWQANGTADTYTDGVLDEQRMTTIPLPIALLYIGGVLPLLTTNAASVFTDGDIAEAIVYTNALKDAERAQVEAYLRAKWAIGP